MPSFRGFFRGVRNLLWRGKGKPPKVPGRVPYKRGFGYVKERPLSEAELARRDVASVMKRLEASGLSFPGAGKLVGNLSSKGLHNLTQILFNSPEITRELFGSALCRPTEQIPRDLINQRRQAAFSVIMKRIKAGKPLESPKDIRGAVDAIKVNPNYLKTFPKK